MSAPALLPAYLQELGLTSAHQAYGELAQRAQREGLTYEQFLLELVEGECLSRRQRRIERLLRASRLPQEKSWESFEFSRLSVPVRRQVQALRSGDFLARRENVLVFGNPGSGKTHLLCGLCQELVRQGHTALYASCSLLVQGLLAAKRELKLPQILKRLARVEALLLDDLGYVQQEREEMDVLFTLLAERYERGSVLLTSNLPFSQWEGIFKDPMTTAAAIDRLVHHSVIVELNLPSYRMEQARGSKAGRQALEQALAAPLAAGAPPMGGAEPFTTGD
jgi:DNA replication protein DnaC